MAVSAIYNGSTGFDNSNASISANGLVGGDTLSGVTVNNANVFGNGSNYITALSGTASLDNYAISSATDTTLAGGGISTTHNNDAMNRAVRDVAVRHLSGQPKITEAMLNHIEVAIRAYDPCLSCATHALGQMPLQVELFDAGGRLVDRAGQGR